MEEQKARLRDAFGESSDSESEPQQEYKRYLENSTNFDESESIFGENPKWERITEINGLCLCRNFLSLQQQSSLLSEIEKEGWFTEASHNQAMRFGDLPAWATEISSSIKEVIQFSDCVSEQMGRADCDKDKEVCLFSSDLLLRDPLFDQLIVNIYQPGEGICAHVDLMRFEDGIAIVSLESSCVMHFSRVETEPCTPGVEANCDPSLIKVPVYLTPGSLVLMWGEARYLWKHEIDRKPGNQRWEGQTIDQKRRTSITLRKLCRSE